MLKKYLAVSTILLGFLVVTLAYGGDIRYALSSDDSTIISPSDHLSDKDLRIFKDKVIIDKEDIKWAKIKDTHSMEPVLNANSISLEISPKSARDIDEGDIISFEQDSIIIIHRVVLVGEDELGWFAATKGDNNQEPDPYKIRFEQIKGIVIGILY